MTKPLVDGYGHLMLAGKTMKVIPPPEIDFEKHSEKLFRILDFNGNLAMLDLSGSSEIDIWVMDYEKQLWGKEYTIGITILGEIYNIHATRVIGLWKQDEILFYFSNGDFSRNFAEYWSYSMKTGDLEECDFQSSHAQIHSLRGSLIMILGAMVVS